MEKKLDVRNRKTLRAFIESEGTTDIEFFRNSKGTCFFMCGTTRGYVSPRVAKMVEHGDIDVDDYQYAECKKPDSNVWIPTIMRNGAESIGKISL